MKLKIVGILGLLVLLILVGCSSPTPIREVTLKLNWLPGAQFIGYFVAQDQGFYAQENLELTIEALNDSPEGRDILTGVLDGDYDFAIGVADLIRAQSEGANLTVFSTIVQLGPGVLFARAETGIKTPREFAGQTVAITSDTGRSNIEKLLLLNGLSLEDIEQVPASFDMTPFYDGEVVVWGGYLSDEVIRVRQNGIEVVTFPLHEYGIEGTTVTMFTSNDLLIEAPDKAIRFTRATLHGWTWAIKNPSEAVDMMMSMFPDLPDGYEFLLASFDAYIPLVRPEGVEIGFIDCEKWVAQPGIVDLENVEGLCTENIFEAAFLDS